MPKVLGFRFGALVVWALRALGFVVYGFLSLGVKGVEGEWKGLGIKGFWFKVCYADTSGKLCNYSGAYL